MSESPRRSMAGEQSTSEATVYEKLAAKREELEAIAAEDVPFAEDARRMLALLDELEEEA